MLFYDSFWGKEWRFNGTHGEQIVRVGLRRGPDPQRELAYRLYLQEVPPPPKRSERARNPFVVVGNAIITIVLLLLIGAGTGYYYGRQVLETPGPLKEDKVVNIPARAGNEIVTQFGDLDL